VNDQHTEAKDQERPDAAQQSTARPVAVDDAIVDCYGESEQTTGPYTIIENNLALPCGTAVLGVPVIVDRVDLTRRGGNCCCLPPRRRGTDGPILDQPLPLPRPAGAEWIDAYRHWLGGE
jgi:hypothetical protein